MGIPKIKGSLIPKIAGTMDILPRVFKRLDLAKKASIKARLKVPPMPPGWHRTEKELVIMLGRLIPAARAAKFSALAAIVSGVKVENTALPWIPTNINKVQRICITRYAGNDKPKP